MITDPDLLRKHVFESKECWWEWNLRNSILNQGHPESGWPWMTKQTSDSWSATPIYPENMFLSQESVCESHFWESVTHTHTHRHTHRQTDTQTGHVILSPRAVARAKKHQSIFVRFYFWKERLIFESPEFIFLVSHLLRDPFPTTFSVIFLIKSICCDVRIFFSDKIFFVSVISPGPAVAGPGVVLFARILFFLSKHFKWVHSF